MGISLITRVETDAARRFAQAFGDVRKVSNKSTEELVSKYARSLALNLARACFKITPSIATLMALPQKLQWRIRRPLGLGRDGAMAEIQHRIKSRKYLGACWLLFTRGRNGRIYPVKNKRGEVRIKWPSVPFQKGYVELINRARDKRTGEYFASRIHEQHGLVDEALNATTADMLPYIKRKRGEAIADVRKAVHG